MNSATLTSDAGNRVGTKKPSKEIGIKLVCRKRPKRDDRKGRRKVMDKTRLQQKEGIGFNAGTLRMKG